MKDIISDWPSKITGQLQAIKPDATNGATFELRRGSGAGAKWDTVILDASLYQLYRMAGWIPLSSERSSQNPLPFGFYHVSGPLEQRLSFVKKSMTALRAISPEPVGQNIGQSIGERILRDELRNPRWHVQLHDQGMSRAICLEYSRNMSGGSIDLSAASDSITVDLVKQIFPTSALSILLRSRTRSVVLDSGEAIKLRKYAGMGNRLTFPLECMIFSAIVQLAFRQHGMTNHVEPWAVYGDDILVPSSIYATVIDILGDLHFEVNQEKSFPPGSAFVESCGIEALNGINVTPVRIPKKYDVVSISKGSPEAISSACDFSNALYNAGFSRCRRHVINSILNSDYRVKFVNWGDPGLYSDEPTNFHLKHRWNAELQRHEVLCDCVVTTQQKIRDDMRYQLTLRELLYSQRRSLLGPDDLIEVSGGETRTRVCRKWVAD